MTVCIVTSLAAAAQAGSAAQPKTWKSKCIARNAATDTITTTRSIFLRGRY